MCEHQDKKMVVHSETFIKLISILLLIVRFVKSSDQAIIQIIRKNKSILMFLITTSKMKVCIVLLVCDLQPSTNATKNSILGVTGVLDPPLGLYNMF